MGMANFLVKLLQYSPLVFEMVKAVVPKAPPSPERDGEQDAAIAELKKDVYRRIEMLEDENAHLRTRLRDMDTRVSSLQLIVQIGGIVLLVLVFLALIIATKH